MPCYGKRKADRKTPQSDMEMLHIRAYNRVNNASDNSRA